MSMTKQQEIDAIQAFAAGLGDGYLKDALSWQMIGIVEDIKMDLEPGIAYGMSQYRQELRASAEKIEILEKQEKDLLTSISELRSAYDRLTLDGIKARRDLDALKAEARRIAGMVA